jgi:hypothetical protein
VRRGIRGDGTGQISFVLVPVGDWKFPRTYGNPVGDDYEIGLVLVSALQSHDAVLWVYSDDGAAQVQFGGATGSGVGIEG